MDNLKEQEQELLKYRAEKLREKIKIPIVEEKEWDISYLNRVYRTRVNENNVYELKNEAGELKEGIREITDIIETYYRKLFKKEETSPSAQERLLRNINIKLSEEQKNKLDAPLSENELGKAKTTLPNGKSPGVNGITKEFIDFFWNDIKDIFMDVFNEILAKEHMSETQRVSAIRIIYKKGDPTEMKNYRPISLLNVDVKIITKALAMRLADALPEIIHNNQKCIPGRHIVNNIHVVKDLIELINKNDDEAALIFLDQEKAFDRVDHDFLIKTLKAFGFGDYFIKWIKILYKNIESKVKVNGFTTKTFPIERGVRQGCPLSALLYILVAEVLGREVRLNKILRVMNMETMKTKSYKVLMIPIFVYRFSIYREGL